LWGSFSSYSRPIGNGVSRVIMSNTQWCWTCRVVHDDKTNDNDLLVQVKSSKCTYVYFVLVLKILMEYFLQISFSNVSYNIL